MSKVIESMLEGMGRLKDAATSAASALASAGSAALASAGGRVGEGRGGIGIGEASGKALSGAASAAGSASKAAMGGGVAGAAGAVAGALSAVAGPALAAASAFSGIAGQIAGFVGAFSPATVQAFQRAMDAVTAIIGSLFTPVLSAATEFVRDFAGRLVPLVEQLQPVIQEVVTALMSFADGFLATFSAISPVIVMVAKVFAFLAEGVVALARPFQAMAIVVATIAEAIGNAISGLLGDGPKGAMEMFTDAMTGLARIIVTVVAKIATFLGALDFVAKLQKAFTPKKEGDEGRKSPDGFKAAQNPALMSFDAFGAAMLKNASIATGEEKNKSPEDWLASIAGDIAAVRSGADTWMDQLGDRIGEKAGEIIGAVIAGLKQRTYDGAKAAGNFALDPLGVWGAAKEAAFGTGL